MNVYDSERIAELLQPEGYQTTESLDDADLVILNTCHIREKATEKTYSEVGRLRKIKGRKKQLGQKMLIAVAGCVAQAEEEEIQRRAPYVDIVIGPQTYHRLPIILRTLENSKPEKGVLDTQFPIDSKFDYLPSRLSSKKVSGFITIQEGCDKFCTFCVVPYTRGSEYSRPPETILKEAVELTDSGVTEIILLGQNVNAYNGTDKDGYQWNFSSLILAMANLSGVSRIRYTTSHPLDMTDELIAVHRDCPKLMPYLHLPAQAGSDRILRSMNRRYSSSQYLAIIEKVRNARPDIALSGDFIVGFPGETDKDFEATLQLASKVNYAQAYSFKYSPRPGTPAAELSDLVEAHISDERLSKLQKLLNQQQIDFNRRTEGKVLEILFERLGKRKGQIVGRTPYMQAVHINAPKTFLGQLTKVKIVAGYSNSLAGEIIDSPDINKPLDLHNA